jgi:ABC-type uncharacterized transport system ATPase subunit
MVIVSSGRAYAATTSTFTGSGCVLLGEIGGKIRLLCIPGAGYRLVLKQFTRIFGDIRAVDNVDLAIENGKLLALLWPSGCGKKIDGFIDPTEGSIEVDGRVLSSPAPSSCNRPCCYSTNRYQISTPTSDKRCVLKLVDDYTRHSGSRRCM